ncbi:hypothetical protein C9J03_11920 [Photobacterium gaetbulicola]|uniref:37-kD nucleoid-associated bacterial protein n=1 Tax=Photobacterium gaetbulicola Gung47 TaxID=658445 RepID=A0A0C5WNI2_9GAMM|nr:hypothetical protein [Photobacterium gaetbulicola]AJR08663.1 hypothetical protein H744_2c1999 [Photobacterium gaetbulicola Gung47]PSU10290.1 hypothetical protein C9J03_11920 [Photobacterium gaetbulicola]
MSEALNLNTEAQEDSFPIKQLFIFETTTDGGYQKADIDINKKQDLLSFLVRVCRLTYSSKSSQAYNFNEDSLVSQYVDLLLSNEQIDYENVAKSIAIQLSTAENKTVKDGTFIIARIKNSNLDSFIISKLDFEKYFARGSFELKTGLPEDNGILKSCLINIDSSGEKEDVIYLSDKNGKISLFWYEKFLMSTPVEKDSLNTQKAYTMFKDAIKRTVFKESKADFNDLVECMNGYFSTNEVFNFDGFIKNTIESYSPRVSEVKIDLVVKEIIRCKNRAKLDGQFNIIVEDVRKHFKKVVKLDEGMELITKGSVKDKVFKTKIKNKYYLVIDTKVGLDEFEERDI